MRRTNEIFNNLDYVDISEFKQYFKTKFNIPESAWEFLKVIEAAGIKQIHKNAFDALHKFLEELNETQEKIPQDFLAKYLKEYFDISAELLQLIATVGGTWLVHGGAARAFLNFILNGVKEIPSDIDLFVVVSQDNLDNPIGKISFGELKQITKRLYVFECKDKKYEISYLPEENKKNMPVIEICKKSAKTRDVKGNALFIELENGKLLDFLQGIQDIRDKKLCLIEEIHTALGFEESNIHQRALEILRIFRILSLQIKLKNSHNQLWQGFNEKEVAYIKQYAFMFSTLKDDGRIRNTLPKFLTTGNGKALLKRLDNLRLLNHFFPYYISIKNLIFSIQYHIDQAFIKNETIINLASLYALLYWPSFCYEYLFVRNHDKTATTADIAKKILLFKTSDPQVAMPLKFTDNQSGIFSEIISLWQRATENFGFENIKNFLHSTKSEEEALTEKIFQFLYTASSHKVLDLSHLKIDDNTEVKLDSQETTHPKDSIDVPDTASKKLGFPRKKTKLEKKKINYSKKTTPKDSPQEDRKSSEESLDQKKEKSFVPSESEQKSPIDRIQELANQPLASEAQVLRKNGTKKFTSKSFRFLNVHKSENKQLPPPQDFYAAIMKKINNNKFEHQALNENDKRNLRAAQQRRVSKHRFFSTSYSSRPSSSMAEVGQSFFRPIYFLMALSIAVLIQAWARFHNETNPYEFYLKENEGRDLISSFIIIFGFVGLWDCMITSRVLKNEQVNLAQIWEKLQHYPDSQIAVNHATPNNNSRANNSTAMLVALSFICAAFGANSNARSIACYYLALVLVSIGAEIKETVTPAPATNSTSNLSR